ncbi:hypothetical protein WDJ50_02560 [Deinococcus sp. VB142]|uniref:Uncharacterized protein n=1 Tax=Deinococcus sp. VB142 TaxID=3112952 RepID=A0AAU6Q3T3_9DEIO
MTTAVALRERVEAVLLPFLGTYTLPSGDSVPALWLGDPPEGTTVSGLECLISPNPRRDTVEAFQYLGAPLAYPIRLVNNAAEADALDIAVNVLAAHFWPFWDDPVLLQATADIPEQTTLSLLYDPTQFSPEETP